MKRWAPWLTSLALVLVVLWARGPRRRPAYRERRLLMDTLVTITAHGSEGADPSPGVAAAFARMAEVEATFSSYRAGTPLARLNQSGELASPSPELRRVLAGALDLSTRAGGRYDPTLGAISDLWGFGPRPPKGERRPPPDAALAAALSVSGLEGVTLAPDGLALRAGLRLDLGGYAKGYAVDEAVRVLREHGLAALVDAGGDMACTGPKPDGKPWRVGVRHPRNRERLLGVVSLDGGAVATSGDYERFFEYQGRRYHHLVDPDTGRPARHHGQVTVRAPTCAEADAWATALFVAPLPQARELARSAGLRALWVPASPGAAGVGDLHLEPRP